MLGEQNFDPIKNIFASSTPSIASQLLIFPNPKGNNV